MFVINQVVAADLIIQSNNIIILINKNLSVFATDPKYGGEFDYGIVFCSDRNHMDMTWIQY